MKITSTLNHFLVCTYVFIMCIFGVCFLSTSLLGPWNFVLHLTIVVTDFVDLTWFDYACPCSPWMIPFGVIYSLKLWSCPPVNPQSWLTYLWYSPVESSVFNLPHLLLDSILLWTLSRPDVCCGGPCFFSYFLPPGFHGIFWVIASISSLSGGVLVCCDCAKSFI